MYSNIVPRNKYTSFTTEAYYEFFLFLAHFRVSRRSKSHNFLDTFAGPQCVGGGGEGGRRAGGGMMDVQPAVMFFRSKICVPRCSTTVNTRLEKIAFVNNILAQDLV